MREIKFRAWIKRGVYENTMLYQDKPDLDGVICYSVFDKDGNTKLYYSFDELMDDKFFELMQFTGLKDKNDTEIYEGDIVNGTFYANQPEISAIEWFDKLAGFTFSKYPMNIHGLHSLEVIGNIYENPDLMEDK